MRPNLCFCNEFIGRYFYVLNDILSLVIEALCAAIELVGCEGVEIVCTLDM